MIIQIKCYGVIYLLKNKINNKIYIGKTVDYNRRMNEHKNRKSTGSKKHNYPIARAIDEYGFENFTHRIIESASNESELKQKEKFYIEKFQSFKPDIGYNSRKGDIEEKLNNTTRLKMSLSHKGLKESPETKRKKSSKIIAFKENKVIISDSGKLFGDFINMSKDKVKNALRMPCRIKGYYVFYLDEEKRKAIYLKSKNVEYKKIYELIEKGVETIEKLYEVEFLSYN